MTQLTASVLGMEERGRLERGAKADVVVFDPERINDPATFQSPHQYADGVVHVLVNGTWALKEGEVTGKRAGTVLRHGDRREAQ
jgi:N-acyl-D-amino-acid deacylase